VYGAVILIANGRYTNDMYEAVVLSRSIVCLSITSKPGSNVAHLHNYDRTPS